MSDPEGDILRVVRGGSFDCSQGVRCAFRYWLSPDDSELRPWGSGGGGPRLPLISDPLDSGSLIRCPLEIAPQARSPRAQFRPDRSQTAG